MKEDFKQYITNLLYSAYTDGKQEVSTAVFDTWIEEQWNHIDEYFKANQQDLFVEQFLTDEDSDTTKCKECGGRTALIHGSFYYEPDSEPYMSGIEEEAKVETGECWVGGYKCDDCGNIQGLWHE